MNTVDYIRSKDKIVNHLDIVLYGCKSQIEDKLSLSISQKVVHSVRDSGYYFATIEVHPTNRCSENCYYCSYQGYDRNSMLSWKQLEKVMTFRPKTITLVGGGDPTLYNDGNHTFSDIVHMYADEKVFPIQLGLITNGVYIPSGAWQDKVAWCRISLDAVNPDTYRELKGTANHKKIIQNIESYISGPIPMVGIGFLFQRKNFIEFPAFLNMCYELDSGSGKVNVQQRGIHGVANGLPSCNELVDIVYEVQQMMNKNSDFEEFVERRTNFHKLLSVKKEKIPWRGKQTPKSSACFYTLLFGLINASGEIYPCRLFSEYKKIKIGNIDEPVETILQRRIQLFDKVDPATCNDECRDDKNNLSLEFALKSDAPPKPSSQHLFI